MPIIPSSPLYRLCIPIYPEPFYIYPLLPWIGLVLPYIPVPSTYPLYSLVSSLSLIYPRTLLHIPSTPLYHLSTPIYTRTLLHIPFTPLYRLFSLIYPCALLHIPSSTFHRLCTPIYHSTLLHIPSTPLCRLCTPIYPRTLLHIPSTPICRLCSPICPRAFLPTPSTPLYRPYTLIYSSLLIIPLMNLQDNGLGSSLVKSRNKRSYHHSHSKKLSIKDLALELAKKHVSSIILKT